MSKPPKKRTKCAEVSYNARIRRKLEVERLKQENSRLLKEQEDFKKQIQEIELEAQRDLGASIEDIEENKALVKEIEQHRLFIGDFLSMLKGQPTAKSAKQELYKEAADNAHSFLLNFKSQSLDIEWNEVYTSGLIKEDYIEHIDFLFHKRLDFCGSTETTKDGDAVERLYLRVDATFIGDPYTPEKVAEFFFQLNQSDEQQCKFLGMSRENIQLSKIAEDAPKDTFVVHFHRKDTKIDAVLLLTKRKMKLAKSTLISPKSNMNEKSKRRKKNPTIDYGTVDATVVTMTSTTLSDVLPKEENTTRISSFILQGVITWNETILQPNGMEEEKTKFCFLSSVPKGWDPMFDDFQGEGNVSPLQQMLQHTATQFKGMFSGITENNGGEV